MNCYFGCNLFCYDVNGIAVVDLAVADVVIVAHFIPPGPTTQVSLPVFFVVLVVIVSHSIDSGSTTQVSSSGSSSMRDGASTRPLR